MKKIAIVTLLSAFAATPALADNTGSFYMAGDLGGASYSNVDDGLGNAFPNPRILRLAGGYHFSPAWAAEVGYSMFGDSTIDYGATGKATLALSSFQVSAVGSYPLNAQFDLVGKLGLTHNNIKETVTGLLVANPGESKNNLLIGLGAQYHVNSQVTLRTQYENFGKFQSGAQPTKATAFSVGVAYNF